MSHIPDPCCSPHLILRQTRSRYISFIVPLALTQTHIYDDIWSISTPLIDGSTDLLMYFYILDQSIDWSIGVLIDQSIDRLTDRVYAKRSIDQLFYRCTVWLIHYYNFNAWSVCFIGVLFDWSTTTIVIAKTQPSLYAGTPNGSAAPGPIRPAKISQPSATPRHATTTGPRPR